MGVFSRNSFGAAGNLGSISSWISSPNSSESSKIWNYGRYAYIVLKATGNNNAGLCNKSGAALGDTTMSGETYNSLKTRDGGRDIPSRPLLESVRISNDGSTDMSDAALYDVDVSFKCYSLSQFETYEAAYFTPGAEVELTFGYKGLGLGGSMYGNVYNFGFSLDASGVYSCNMKLTGKNRFAAILEITNKSSQTGTTATDVEGTEFVGDSIIGELTARFVKTFPKYEESSFIQRSATQDFVEDGRAVAKDGYAVANIQTAGGGDFSALGLRIDTDDQFTRYCTYEELVDVINWCHSNSGFTWGFGNAQAKSPSHMCSADPTKILLDGDLADYGGDDDTSNKLQTGVGVGHHRHILISIDFIGKLLSDLKNRENEDKEEKGDTSVNNFIRVLNQNIKDLTGGLYPLTLWSDDAEYKNGGKFKIVHERAEHTKGVTGGYNFTLHDLGSVLTSVNMSSNMDSDMAAAALTSNRGGPIPDEALSKLYPGCGNAARTSVGAKITADEVQKKKETMGAGFDATKSEDIKSAMSAWVSQNLVEAGVDAGYRYMIDLEVSHYGCWGTQVGDTFTFSGVPSKYKGVGKYFCVGKIEHTFDGQGNWDTSVTGFLKLDA